MNKQSLMVNKAHSLTEILIDKVLDYFYTYNIVTNEKENLTN